MELANHMNRGSLSSPRVVIAMAVMMVVSLVVKSETHVIFIHWRLKMIRRYWTCCDFPCMVEVMVGARCSRSSHYRFHTELADGKLGKTQRL